MCFDAGEDHAGDMSATPVAQVASQVVALGAMIWGLKVCLHYIDPYREQREQVRSAVGRWLNVHRDSLHSPKPQTFARCRPKNERLS